MILTENDLFFMIYYEKDFVIEEGNINLYNELIIRLEKIRDKIIDKKYIFPYFTKEEYSYVFNKMTDGILYKVIELTKKQEKELKCKKENIVNIFFKIEDNNAIIWYKGV